MTPSELSKALNVAARECERKCDVAIEYARKKYVIPFCEKHGCKFIAGMGSWSFHGGSIGQMGGWCDDRLPKRLLAVLRNEHPLNHNNDCGSLMADYVPTNYKP